MSLSGPSADDDDDDDDDDDMILPFSEEHILAMIAKITSPMPGPSTLHRPRRKTLRGVARGVVFIQRIKWVSFAVLLL